MTDVFAEISAGETAIDVIAGAAGACCDDIRCSLNTLALMEFAELESSARRLGLSAVATASAATAGEKELTWAAAVEDVAEG